MNTETIVALVGMGVSILIAIISIVRSFVKGDMQKFIEQKMVEAEKTGKSGEEKYQYVLDAFKEKYKLTALFFNLKKFVETIIDLTKKINH